MKMRRILVFLTMPCFLVGSRSIVFNGMHSSDSHTGSMLPVAMRLLKEGHAIHFLESHNNGRGYNYPPNITSTFLSIPRDDMQKLLYPAVWTQHYGPEEFSSVWLSGDKALLAMLKNHRTMLSKVLNTSWDMVVSEDLFAVSSYSLSLLQKQKGVPFALMATCAPTNAMRFHYALGGSIFNRPALFMELGRPYSADSFTSRLIAATHSIRNFIQLEYVTTYKAVNGMCQIGITNFHLSQLAQQSSYYFIDEIHPLLWPAPVGNDVIHIGFSCPKVKDLPPKYKNFIEDPTSKGTILIAFGTSAVWEFAPKSLIKTFVDGINLLKDYRVIFTFNGNMEDLQGLENHCMVTKWAPQKEILAHNSTKVFVSHGGLKSLKDTVCNTVPVAVMPLFAEQPHNAEFARQAGIGDILVKTELTAKILSNTVLKLAGT